MAATNSDIARLFTRYATLLEIGGASPFRVRAYRNAARTLEELPQNAAAMVHAGRDLTVLQGIGKDLATKIAEIVETGHLAKLDELQLTMPPALIELTALPGIGPKRIKHLYDELGVESLAGLRRAAESGAIRQIRGFGPSTERHILTAIAKRPSGDARITWLAAEQAALPLAEALSHAPHVEEVTVAGSFRRRRETVGDLDIVVCSSRSATVMAKFVGYEDVEAVLSKGHTRSTVRLKNGLQVDLRVVAAASYGAALQYFTGSKAHNIVVRTRAAKRGFKLSEYGLYKGRRRIAGRTEQEIYERLGLRYIEPELREDHGEVDAAASNELPKLVELEDLRGDLHCHTDASDGKDTLESLASAAEQLGYEYLAISDHTRHLRIAHGLDRTRLKRQMTAIDKLNARLKKLTLLKAAEVDVLEDGSLDLPDSELEALDVVVVAIHDHFDLPPARQTERLLRAMDHPCCNIVAHPTARLLDHRNAIALDMDRIMTGAKERGCYLEVNAQPERLDLADEHCRMAKAVGLKLAISTDAHSTAQLRAYMRLGVAQARRGWLEATDVLNTRSLSALRRLLRR